MSFINRTKTYNCRECRPHIFYYERSREQIYQAEGGKLSKVIEVGCLA